MRIFITIPSMVIPHGGTRVIIEWANRLSKWHDVTLYSLKPGMPTWILIHPTVKIVFNIDQLKNSDCLIITSPHSIHLQKDKNCPKKVFIFMQMVEHLFRPTDIAWVKQCRDFYTSPHTMFAISQWNVDVVKKEFGNNAPVYYIGNGVNLDDFPVEVAPKDGKTVLVEGWEGYNPAKDVENIGPRVAARLKKEGYRILAFGQVPIKTMPDVPDKYYLLPNLKTMNYLYSKATIMIKASRYDARSCAPMEAMTKGTVTARAIIAGDDDLMHTVNSIKVGYTEQELYTASKYLFDKPEERQRMSNECIEYVQHFSWDYWMEKINAIITA